MALVKSSVNGLLKISEQLIVPDSAGANVVSIAGSNISENLDNSKFIVQCTIDEVSAGDGLLDVAIQASVDGITFADVDAVTVDALSSLVVDVSQAALADLTNVYAPYYRFKVLTSGANDTLDTATVTVAIAIKE